MSTILTPDTRLCDAIMLDAALIPLVGRLGIPLGVGVDTIGDICERHKLNQSFFLAIVNTFINRDYMPSSADDVWSLEALLDYLQLTDRFYAEVQLPNIQRHLMMLMQRSNAESNLALIMNYFMSLKEDLHRSANEEDAKWFAIIRDCAEGSSDHTCLVEGIEQSIESRNVISDKVNDLASIFVRHLKGDFDQNLCMAVVNAIFLLRDDISQNNRIRERILLPMVKELQS